MAKSLRTDPDAGVSTITIGSVAAVAALVVVLVVIVILILIVAFVKGKFQVPALPKQP